MFKFQVSRYNLINKKIPHKKILFLSDLHSEFPLELHSLISSEKIDYIFITGDIFNKGINEEIENLDEMLFNLRSLSQKCLIYCSLGNHEFKYDNVDYICEKLKENNLHLLDDESIELDGFYLYGLTPIKRGTVKKENMENFPLETDRTIVLCHKPLDYIENIQPRNPFLTLSGHNHGGQWRLFGIGIYAPDEGLFPKYTSGFYFKNKLLVSRGLGNKCGIPRINNKPQVIILTIN